MELRDERWRRADRILQAALDLEEPDRAALLDTECGTDAELRALVERLLTLAQTDPEWLSPAGRSAPGPAGPAATADPGADLEGVQVDRWRLVREIGRGGMAVVWLAERADGQFEQQVAVKLIKRGIDTDEVIRRFARERQILARANHPALARVLDGGVAPDGRPYFVMEYVPGAPIDRHCDERELDVEARLRLFLRVGAAVAWAHRNLVVHRDIKPTNILVTPDGDPKLMDFGIARLLDDDDGDLTRTHGRLLTPAFASPEQVRGEPVTTASDVYQLGLLLHLLLAGRLPYSVDATNLDTMRRTICEDTPRAPSETAAGDEEAARHRGTTARALARRLAGDLDNIVATALRKEPERRYASVGQLMDDVVRHLDGRPVAARPDTIRYRTSKLIRRHRVAASIAGAAFFFLAAFSVAVSVQAGRVAKERDRANREAAASERVTEFLVDVFELADPGTARGNEVTAREILDRGAERARTELAEDPALRAKLLLTIGRVYEGLGLYERARGILEEALAARQAAPDDLALADVAYQLGWVCGVLGDLDASDASYRLAEERLRAAGAEETARMANVLDDLGMLQHRRDRNEEAVPLLRRALDLRLRVLGEDHVDTASGLNNLATALQYTGDLDGAEACFRRALAIHRAKLGADHPAVTTNVANLALLLMEKGDLDAAEPLMRESVELERRVLGPDHPNLAIVINNLGSLLRDRGDCAGALPLFRESLAILERSLADHWLTSLLRANVGECLARTGRAAEAETMLAAGVAGLESALGPDHERTQRARERLEELRAPPAR